MLFKDSLFRDSFFEGGPFEGLFTPEFLISKKSNDDGSAEVYIELPGVAKDALELEQENNVVHIKADKKVGDKSTLIERKFTINKYFDASLMKAKLVDGILTLTIPAKKNDIPNTKKIMVT